MPPDAVFLMQRFPPNDEPHPSILVTAYDRGGATIASAVIPHIGAGLKGGDLGLRPKVVLGRYFVDQVDGPPQDYVRVYDLANPEAPPVLQVPGQFKVGPGGLLEACCPANPIADLTTYVDLRTLQVVRRTRGMGPFDDWLADGSGLVADAGRAVFLLADRHVHPVASLPPIYERYDLRQDRGLMGNLLGVTFDPSGKGKVPDRVVTYGPIVDAESPRLTVWWNSWRDPLWLDHRWDFDGSGLLVLQRRGLQVIRYDKPYVAEHLGKIPLKLERNQSLEVNAVLPDRGGVELVFRVIHYTNADPFDSIRFYRYSTRTGKMQLLRETDTEYDDFIGYGNH